MSEADTTTTKAPGGESGRPVLHDVIIIGAGLAGMYQLYRLRDRGFSVRVFEAGDGVGGTWYWNRYPGARFDSESYTYGYSFSEELLEEWDWSEHFSAAARDAAVPESRRRQFDLLPGHPSSASRVSSAAYDEAAAEWHDRDRRGQARTAPLPGHRRRYPLGRYAAEHQGHGELPRRVPSHRSLAAPAGRLRGQARRRHRHRRDRRAGHPGSRQDRGAAHRLPAHPELVRAAAATAPSPTEEQRADQGAATRTSSSCCRETHGGFIHNADPRGTFEVTPEEREAF